MNSVNRAEGYAGYRDRPRPAVPGLLKRLRRFALAGVLSAILPLCPAVAGERAPDDWQYTFSPYAWGLSLKGESTVDGNKSDVDVDFDTILDNLNVAGMFEVDARRGRLGFMFSPVYGLIEDDSKDGGTEVDGEVALTIATFGAYYRFGPRDLPAAAGGPRLITDIYAGGRYTSVDVELKVTLDILGTKIKRQDQGDQDWLDPIVGVRTLWVLSPAWTLSLRGDYGGFGLVSDYQWMARGLLGYRLAALSEYDARLWAGYQYLRQEYDDGNGSDRFEWDMKTHGPMLGLSMHF